MTAIKWTLLVIAVLVGFAGLVLIPTWLEPPLSASDLGAVPAGEKRVTLQQAQGQLQNNVRSTLLQGLGGVLLVAGAAATWRQVRISREGQITDRLTRAVDQLGDDKIDVRVGGIFALERLAKDSVTDRLAIVEILAGFIRSHAPWPAGYPSHPDPHPTSTVDETMLWLTDRAADVRTAVLVLGRLPRDPSDRRLSLRRVDLRRTNFYQGSFNSVDLADANLAACYGVGTRWEASRLANADLRKARLAGAVFDGSRMENAHLQDANLEGALLRAAKLSGASLCRANLRDADLRGSDLARADLCGTDLRGADLKGANLEGITTDQATKWPDGFAP